MLTKENKKLLLSAREFIFICAGYIFFIPFFLIACLLSVIIKILNIGKNAVFVGLYEISTNAQDFIRILEKNEKIISLFLSYPAFNSFSYNVLKNPDFVEKSSILKLFYKRIYLYIYFFYAICLCDRFAFFWKDSFFPFNLDFLLLRMLKKKTLVWYCGSDIRYAPIHAKIMNELGYASLTSLNEPSSNKDFLAKFFRQKITEKFCIVHSSREKGTFLKKAAIFFRTPFSRILPIKNKKAKSYVKICHFPSCPSIKGTAIVLEAVRLLKEKKVDFEFIYRENIKNDEVLKFLKTADILVDYPGTIWGTLACEAMGSGCVVVGANEAEFECLKKPPIVKFPVCASYLALILEKLIRSAKLRQRLMGKGICYFQEELGEDLFLERLKKVFDGTIEKNVLPIPNIKNMLLKYAENNFQHFIIKRFF